MSDRDHFSTSGDSDVDRRSHPRLPLELRVVEMDSGAAYFRYATNISPGGLFIEGPAPYPIGTQLTLVFIAPGDDEPTSVLCEVVGTTDGPHRGNHIKFLDPEDSDLRQRMRTYVRAKTAS
jgi:Tfp pilus assembly protein PilZ